MRSTRSLAYFAATIFCAGAAALSPIGLGGFDLSWHTTDSGGGRSLGGDYALSGTIGQPDAGGPLTGGDYALVGGFWTGAGITSSPCVGDVDGDSAVGFGDLVQILSTWGSCLGCLEDLDGDGIVGFSDLVLILASWGPCP